MTLPLRRMQVKVKLNIIFLNDMKRINKYLFIVLVEREIKLEKKKNGIDSPKIRRMHEKQQKSIIKILMKGGGIISSFVTL